MADKEATVFILDLGASMAQKHSGREESDLDWSMCYVWDKITDIVAANRKTLCVGVVGLRTDETNNKLQEDDGYENISVIQELSQITMSGLRALQASVKPSETMSGDAVSAIVVAVDLIDTFTKKLKWVRKIVLVTDGQGEMDADGIEDIAKKINDSGIKLTVLGVDFDNPQYGFKEEDKPPTKAASEKTLKALTDQCKGGIFATMAEAIDELDTPRVKSVKPYKTYDGALTLGDPEKFPAAMNINVERYFKTHLARPLTASTVVVKSEQATQSTQTVEDDAMDGIEFSAVKQARTYKVNDPDAPGGKRDVEFESLAKGYEYGRTAVHISESEHNITKLETEKSFSIVGFIPWSKYEPFLNMGEVCVTHARKNDIKSELALSSLIWALLELESYAVARIVTKDGKDPLLVLMAPQLELGLECLYDIPLPFAEDVRTYQFPPLDRVITVSGQTLKKHRLLPSDELAEAMSDYVDAMDLATYGQDNEGCVVPPKAKGRRTRETVKPISGLDVDALLGEDTKRTVSAENPVPDFKRALGTADEMDQVEDAAKQMGNIVRSLITDSFGDSKYPQATECLGVMRDELINMDEPEMYNTFVRDLKKGLLSGALGGDRRDFWFKVTHEEAEEVRMRIVLLDQVLTFGGKFYKSR
ncbi:Ku70/Ku80 domain & Ku-core domain containing protein [Metarhizium acridum CQMa 102]|uniref:ATP-dependent DNA helicase II subunit 2 n=1 Tax=Metarhizium acridum (strain CQMa 102) TaxID=655827 RepID=E9DRL3_METAQ|nr:Ku70/Ku80 domain & Ku-core domain containing protein [Metarhizium acridum CQMa 102]EFY93891.1 Ku70/Ku80 domain & Ku-core domain containing protein [Metarhizium acridum CQMa 102]